MSCRGIPCFDEVQIFMTLSSSHFIVPVKQNKNEMYAQSLKFKIYEERMQLNKPPLKLLWEEWKNPQTLSQNGDAEICLK